MDSMVRRVLVLVAVAVTLGWPPPPASGQAPAEEVSFMTSDGFLIKGTYIPGGPGRPVAFLLHQLGSDRREFGPFAALLAGRSMHVLSWDARGHGESTSRDGEEVSWRGFSDAEFLVMTKDIAAALEFLEHEKGLKPGRLALVGASIQSSTSLVFASDNMDVDALVLLSPGLSYRDIDTEGPMGRYGKRPVFIAASRGDSRSFEAAVRLSSIARGPKEVELLRGTEHGVGMFRAEPGLAGRVASWLEERLK